MGIFGSKPKSGPSAEDIRAQEEKASQERAQKALVESEAKRKALRQRQSGATAEEDISRKTLFGQ